ncbi:MAG: SDR family oxidoreductase [Acidobacteria bacterium]|nr:SDR family oxidoreductase [Acidobacteriota bacterium]
MNEFKGKTALVTGASRGIGAAAAVALAAQGCGRVIVHYNSYPEGAEQALNAIRAAGAEGVAIQADLSTMEGTRKLAGEVAGLGGIHYLINNAGSLIRRATLDQHSEELFDTVMNLNVKSLWFLTQAIVPAIEAAGGGAVVNVSSIAARNGGGPGATIYAAAKAAVSAITKGLAKELAPKNIRVNAVSPGTVDNHFHEMFSTKAVLEGVVKATPAGRLATNEDISDCIVFLCSSRSSYILGQTIEINGGFYMV